MERPAIVILGGSGNVGKEAVKFLLMSKYYSNIHLISRRPLPEMEAMDPSITVQVCNLDKLGEELHLKGKTSALMALGAGKASELDKDELYRVDTQIPVDFAKKCKADGIEHMTVLSAVGSDPNSTYSSITKSAAGFGWYRYCKGQLEEQINNVGFKSTSIFRPAAITGNTNTPGFLNWLSPHIDFLMPNKYKSISTVELGRRMANEIVKQQKGESPGFSVYEGQALQEHSWFKQK